ncbi:MAG: TOTE conflict system archaeo-eukaryotic primase domain-containing protein [Terracidiphilus sp.]
MERRHQLGLDSNDRLYPNQDTMPKGGFGNLIALPLQFAPRRSGNSVFVDADLHPSNKGRIRSNCFRLTSLGRCFLCAILHYYRPGASNAYSREDAEDSPRPLLPDCREVVLDRLHGARMAGGTSVGFCVWSPVPLHRLRAGPSHDSIKTMIQSR